MTGELARTDAERDVLQYFAAAQADAYVFEPEQVCGHHRCSVDTWPATAFCRSWTSVSIQDW